MLYKRQATTFTPCPPLELFSKILLFIVPAPNYEMGFSPLCWMLLPVTPTCCIQQNKQVFEAGLTQGM